MPGVLEHCHFIDDIKQATVFNDLLRSKVVLAANAGKDLDVVISRAVARPALNSPESNRNPWRPRYDSDARHTDPLAAELDRNR